MHGVWFDPPAPAGFHRCTVQQVVDTLLGTDFVQGNETIIGVPGNVPKHWAKMINPSLGTVERSSSELRQFLRKELATTLKINVESIAEDAGLVGFVCLPSSLFPSTV